MSACIFCAIASGQVPCRKVYDDTDFLAFHDVEPQAPTHVLIIPKQHLPSLAELTPADGAIMGRLTVLASQIASQLGLDEKGYRWVINCGPDACQTVPHVHLHLLGGRPMGWPPG
jgi:histidine triad (HIT) family protein